MSNSIKRLAALVAGTVAALAGDGALAAYGDLNMQVGVTPISREAYDLHMLIFVICVIIGIIVFGAMFFSIINHRKSVGHEPAKFHHSTKAEIIWTLIPCLILIGMAVPATKALIAMEDTSDPDLTLKVTAYQWKWRYDYLDSGVVVHSNLAHSSRAAIHGDPTSAPNYLLEVDEPIVFPVNRKVRLLVTADDVIHAWWVPAFGMKKDAIPGFVNEMWVRAEKTGVYRGQCAELCGKDHGFMPIVVHVKSDEDYAAWVAEKQAAQGATSQTVARALGTGGIN